MKTSKSDRLDEQTESKTDEKEQNEIKELKQIISELEQKLETEKNARLMALADLQNYRKRIESDRQAAGELATKNLLNTLIEIVDDFNRANQATDTEISVDEKLKGYELIFDKIRGLIEEQGLELIKVEPGDKFDPSTMEALTSVPTENEDSDNSVIHIESFGYRLKTNKQVFKTAKVIIAKYQK